MAGMRRHQARLVSKRNCNYEKRVGGFLCNWSFTPDVAYHKTAGIFQTPHEKTKLDVKDVEQVLARAGSQNA
jgi:hypothetical protein